MKSDSEFPDDVLSYTDSEAVAQARRQVFDLEVDLEFKSSKTGSEINEVLSEATEFVINHLGKKLLIETEDRHARVFCNCLKEGKLIFIAFVNQKTDLSPYETQPWAIAVTPRRETIERYVSIFLGFCLYDQGMMGWRSCRPKEVLPLM